jgi:hypothetical protein
VLGVWYKIRTRINNREPLFRYPAALKVFAGVRPRYGETPRQTFPPPIASGKAPAGFPRFFVFFYKPFDPSLYDKSNGTKYPYLKVLTA